MSTVDFSSWPRCQEQSFVVYEQYTQASQKKAFTAAVIAGLVALVFMLGVYAGVTPDQRDVTKDMNMSNLTKKSTTTAPAAPAADKK